jgi:hypothetical protein
MRRLPLVLIGLLLLISGFVSVPATRAQQGVSVTEESSEVSFPEGITFSLVADSPTSVARVELLYRVADLETLHLEAPDFTPGTHIEVTHAVDFQLNYQPAGVDIFYRWRLIDEQGNVHDTDEKSVTWYDARFTWDMQKSQDVEVYAYNRNEAFNKLILDRAQQAVDELRVEYGVDQVTAIRIWIYNSGKDFAGSQQGNSSEWIAGTAYQNLHLILATIPEGNKSEIGRIIPHEISHQILFQATRNPFNITPTWFDEGLAVNHQDNGNEDFPAMVRDAAERGQLFSIRALNSNFPYDASETALAYAESSSIVTFIVDRFGEEKLKAVVDAYREGVSHDEAFRIGLGVDLTELDRLWKESLGYKGDQPRSTATTSSKSGEGPGVWDDPIDLIIAAVVVVALTAMFVSNRRRDNDRHLRITRTLGFR